MNGKPVNNKSANGKPAAGGNANGGSGNGVQHEDGALGIVRPADITQEMQVAYLDYAMSVIVARALPDVRDGLKPVHRRILYAMWHDLSLTHDKPHKKSARIVGEVLGKYHPHGDTAVYDAMVRMAQNFSLRYPLVDGQGNFGSVDGDNAAAMRYTEARLERITDLMLTDLEKDTVGWHPNFDNTLREPDILPAALPNLLINGSSGIAVGMATNIPPHNLGEVVDALVYMIDRFDAADEITTEELMHFVKGPDFPTGGIIYRFREEGKGEDDADAIAQGYSLGKSRLIVQAKAHFEEISRGRTRIVVTELPYQTNKTALLERIADLVRDGKIEGISDLRDESDRTGMRIVIELSRTAEPKDILANLYKYTPLQQTFGMQMLALVDGQPRLLSLKRMLQYFVQHRQEIIRRRSEYELKQARERAHIVEGLLRALDILDEVIHTIRHSQTVDTARKNLIANFKFSEAQAQAILDMQLRRLAALERKKLQEEFNELQKRIAYLEDLLANPHKILGVIREELLAIREQYSDARRTQIVDRTRGALTTHDLLPDQMVWVSVSKSGDVRRLPVVDKPGAAALRQAGKDSQVALLRANTRDLLYIFARDGRCARMDVHQIPADDTSKSMAELTGFKGREGIAAVLALPRERSAEGKTFFFVSERGVVKRVSAADVQANTASEFTVFNVEEGDRLGWALHTEGSQEVLLVSAEGQSIRFGADEVRAMGLAAGGVGGMKLRGKDRLVHAAVVDEAGELVTISAAGFAKRTTLAEYSRQGRNGGGILAHKLVERTGKLTAALLLPAHAEQDQVILVSGKGVARPMEVSQIPRMGRAASGKQVLTLAERDSVVAAWHIQVPGSLNGPDGGDGGAGEAAAAVPQTVQNIGQNTGQKTAPKQRVAAEQVELLEEAAAPRGVQDRGGKTPVSSATLPLKQVDSRQKRQPAPAAKQPAAVQTPDDGASAKPISAKRISVKIEAEPLQAAAEAAVAPVVEPDRAGAKQPARAEAPQRSAAAKKKPSETQATPPAEPAKTAAEPQAGKTTQRKAAALKSGKTEAVPPAEPAKIAAGRGAEKAPSRKAPAPEAEQPLAADAPAIIQPAAIEAGAAVGKVQPKAAPAAKGKPSSRPTPAQIASGAASAKGRGKQPVTPRFDFGEEDPPERKSAGGVTPPRKLDVVVSVTKNQAPKPAPDEKPAAQKKAAPQKGK